ncbi:MAG: choice-of-anchor P family protein [Candidatus Acidiferrales bacterium]
MPKESVQKTFLYNAHGHALSGHIRRPIDHVIEVQACSSLPTTGGYGGSRVDNFQLPRLVSFKSGQSVVSGTQNPGDGSYTTLVAATIEGLNILDVVTADRVVARLSSIYTLKGDEPSIITIGSEFENLRIAGHPVQVELDHEFFLKADTFAKITKELASDAGFRKIAEDPFHTGHSQKLPKPPGAVICSLVKNLPTCPGVTHKGNVYVIPQFGKVFVAEVITQHAQRTLTMLRLELGSPVSGTLVAAQIVGNGTTYP